MTTRRKQHRTTRRTPAWSTAPPSSMLAGALHLLQVRRPRRSAKPRLPHEPEGSTFLTSGARTAADAALDAARPAHHGPRVSPQLRAAASQPSHRPLRASHVPDGPTPERRPGAPDPCRGQLHATLPRSAHRLCTLAAESNTTPPRAAPAGPEARHHAAPQPQRPAAAPSRPPAWGRHPSLHALPCKPRPEAPCPPLGTGAAATAVKASGGDGEGRW
jgi:hypothetical protein